MYMYFILFFPSRSIGSASVPAQGYIRCKGFACVTVRAVRLYGNCAAGGKD